MAFYILLWQSIRFTLIKINKSCTLGIMNEHGWYTEINSEMIMEYLETEQEHREKKLSSLLEK